MSRIVVSKTGLIPALLVVGMLIVLIGVGCGGGGGGGTTDGSSGFLPVTSPVPANGAVNIPITQTLSWAASTGATYYDIYFGLTSTGWTAVMTTTGLTYNPGGLAYSTTYYWRIDAKNAIASAAGTVWSFTTMALPAPGGVAALAGDSQATISWNSVSGATVYNIYWATSTGVTKLNGTLIAGVTSPHVHTGLTNWTVYYYVVTAGDGVVESAESLEASATPGTIPDAPTGLAGTAGDIEATLTWNSSANATLYNIYWATTTGVTKLNGTKISGVTSPYDHTSLTNFTTYYYVVTAENSFGESTESSEVLVMPGAVPAVPAGVAAVAGDGQVNIIWNSVTGATLYNIYWATATGVTMITGTKISGVTSPYAHTGLDNDTAYYYVVTAENSFGESVESVEVSATPSSSGLPPEVPTGLSATAGNGQITLSWNSVTNTIFYNIYWSNTTGVTATTGTLITTTANSYIHTSLTPWTNYYYIVSAENTYGASDVTAEVSAAPGAVPDAPTSIYVTAGNTEVTVSWTDSANATLYNIYWATATGVTKLNGTKIAGATSPYAHTGLTNFTTYYYIVTAENSFGESVESTEASTMPGDIPAIPLNVGASAGNTQITVSWDSVTGATLYNIYWATATGVTKLNGTKIAGVTSPYDHTGLDNFTDYYYVVTAENSFGESAESLEASAMPGIIPAAPSGFIADSGDTVVTLTWNSVLGADSYNIYWALTADVSKITGTKITGVASPFAHIDLNNFTDYYYVVTAENSFGESADSTIASATPGAIPAAPENVTADPGNMIITLTWNPVPGAALYNIYWSTSTGVTMITGTKISGVTSPYVHSGLTEYISYYYVVTAENSLGESVESAEASADLLIQPPSSFSIGNDITQLLLSWSSVQGATSYNIYWLNNFGVTKLNGNKIEVAGTAYTHTGLTPFKTYYYVITALQDANESAESIELPGTPFAMQSISAGTMNNLALAPDGTAWAWGYNSDGQLGNGTLNNNNTPGAVIMPDGIKFIAIASGMYHKAGVAQDGTVWTWGNNEEGQLGDDTQTNHKTPVYVRDSGGVTLTGITAIALGGFHSLALDQDGAVWSWGDNSNGQLGDGTGARPVQSDHYAAQRAKRGSDVG